MKQNDVKNYEFVLRAGTELVSKNKDGKERRYTIEQVVNGKPLQKGQKIKSDDEVRPVLGQGGFGITYLASRQIKDGNINLGTVYYAIKEFFVKGSCWRDEDSTQMLYSPAAKSDVLESLKDFREEANRLKEICKGNPNIVNVNEVFEANGTAYYVMEFLEGESLRNLVKRTGPLSEGVALNFIRPIAEAVNYIHTRHRLLHLDIKPDNIMLRKAEDGQSAEPVLIDFGVSVHFNKKGDLTTTHHSTGVSEGFSPQEQYGGVAKIVEDRRRAHKDGFTSVSLIPCEVDVYALGATLYYILVGTNPYGAFTMNENIIREKLPQTISDKTRQVILNAMKTSASVRTQTAAEFLKGFSDRYTLPKGYVLRSPNARYLITDILEESDSYIRYGATLFSGSQTDESGNATTKRRYTVFERFNQKRYKRLKDESVSCSEGSAVVKSREQQEFLAVCKKHIGLGNDGEADFDSSIIVREIFDTNGTSYAVVKQGWKPEPPVVGLFRKILDFFRLNLKQIGKVIAFICIFCILGYGVYYGIEQIRQWQFEREMQKEYEFAQSQELSDAIEKNDSTKLLEFSAIDSVRAFIPLAKIYLNANDTTSARKYAELAISGGDQKGADIIEQIEALTPRYITISDLLVEKDEKKEESITVSVETPTKQSNQPLADSEAQKKKERERIEKEQKEKEKKDKEQKELEQKKRKEQEQKEAGQKALNYVNGTATDENHRKAYEWAQKADPATRAKVIQRLKEFGYPVP